MTKVAIVPPGAPFKPLIETCRGWSFGPFLVIWAILAKVADSGPTGTVNGHYGHYVIKVVIWPYIRILTGCEYRDNHTIHK